MAWASNERRVEKGMKQKLDAARTLAIQLYEAAQKEKENWEQLLPTPKWRDLTKDSVAIWDAVAIEAYRRLKK